MPDVSPAPVGAVSVRRGKSQQPNWRRTEAVSVIRLELDVSGDPRMRQRVEKHFGAVYQLRRALQNDARSASRAYLSARRERADDPKALRDRLGLTRKAVENMASDHVNESKWMRAHLTKAAALHVADEVWETCDRFLFSDASGRRAGAPRIGDWWDFRRVPGRAKSHTKTQPTWETYRLVGSLQGHLNVYSAARWTVAEAVALPTGTSVFSQPRSLMAPRTPKSWHDYDGPLAVVYTGLKGGDLVLPVRLPSGSGRFLRLAHFLADPNLWHKIDLVRTRDQAAPGGWRYAAHLTVLAAGYVSDGIAVRRASVPQDRRAGIDGNVSNVAVASFNNDNIAVSYLTPTPAQRAVAARETKKARERVRALDRSRRASNRAQYGLSKRQHVRAERRSGAGLLPRTVELPKGQRVANMAGVPTRSHRRDVLTGTYRKTRAVHAEQASAAIMRSRANARQLAAHVVAVHGPHLVVEDVNVSHWMRLWGKAVAATTPGRVIDAIRAEAEACGGQILSASTFTTALSQHCVCGRREKKPLSQRWHHCPDCGLGADRDLLSAALAACVSFTNPADPGTASLNTDFTTALAARLGAQQEALVRSTASRPTPHPRYRNGKRGSHLTVAPAGQGNSTVLPQNSPTRASLEQTDRSNPRKQLRINS